jgi:transformation/transcription domain-associated protein
LSKTLGEKLLDRLQYWSDSDKIIKHYLCKEGDEPLVAAGILEMFQLLPDSAHFVEPLVKTTIKLEAAIPQYKANIAAFSPFRVPLAKYLNNYGPALAHFFINEHRLKKPVYSDLIQDIIRRPESVELRSYLSGSECTQTILNICFDRPSAIIRSE